MGEREGGVVARRAPDLHEIVRTINAWQRLQEDRLDPGEDRRIGPNAQGQGDDDRRGEARSLSQRAEAVSKILPEGFHLYSQLGRVGVSARASVDPFRLV